MSITRAKKAASPRKSSHKPDSSSEKQILNVQGRDVPVSRLNKVYYPKSGFTKAQVIDYYIRISPVLLPHLENRPLTLKRYPDGVEGGFFYEKRCPPYRPTWIKTAPIWSEGNNAEIHYCLANDLPSMVWAANLGDLELHTFLAKADKVNQPTMLVFDLDPGPPANVLHCAEVGLLLKERLDELKLQSFPKTSGSKGLQVYVPLNTPTTYEQTKPFAHAMADQLQSARPELIVSRMEKRLRTGKVFVDWSQNDQHKTTVCVYSLRAKERPTASTPVEWDEVKAALKKKDAGRLSFLSDQVLQRVTKNGDLFQPVLKLKQKLPTA
ncbi:MAG: non-homologous end-joining DNA ligase [Verrucomicrobiota bacterium]